MIRFQVLTPQTVLINLALYLKNLKIEVTILLKGISEVIDIIYTNARSHEKMLTIIAKVEIIKI